MAYLFGAANTDGIDCGTAVTTGATFSVFVRVKVTAANTVYRALATYANSTTGVEYQMFLAFGAGTTNIVTFGFGAAGTYPAATWTSGFTAGSTHTLVGTYDGANLRIYADTDATAKVTQATTLTPDSTSIRFQIGQDQGFGNNKSADSTLYEVGWWPGTVLTGAQAAGMGAGTAPPTSPSDYWPLVSDALAFTGGHNGTVTGASVVAHSGTNLYGAGAVTETFTHTDFAGSLTADESWTALLGADLGIVGERGRNANVGVVEQLARCDTAVADGDNYDVSLVLPTFPTEAFAGVVYTGLMARMSVAGAVSGYELRLVGATGVYQLNIYRRDDAATDVLLGAGVDLVAALGGNPVAGDAMRFNVTGSTLTGFFTHASTETQVVQRTDATYGAGRRLGGIRSIRTASDVVEFDDWTIAPATSTMTPVTPRFTVSARTQMASAAAMAATLDVFPDTGQGIINNGDGTYTFIAASGGSSPASIGQCRGTFTNPLATSSGFMVGLSGQKDCADRAAADVYYQAGGPVYVDPASGLWLQIIHYEMKVHPAEYYGPQYYATLGIAKSSNQGATWTDCGEIITAHHTIAEMEALWTTFGKSDGSYYNAEIGWGPYVIVGPYMYVYYIYVDGEIQDSGGLTYQEGMGVARALVADIVSAAASTTVPIFHKYNAGTWTELGIHGFGTKVLSHYATMAWNIPRSRYIAMRIADFTSSGNAEYGYWESTDGVNWTGPEIVLHDGDSGTLPPMYWYWTIIDPDSGVPYVTTDDTFYLSTWSVQNHDWSRYTVTLDVDTPSNRALLRSASWRGAWRGEFVGT